jgi:hypothetical protein
MFPQLTAEQQKRVVNEMHRFANTLNAHKPVASESSELVASENRA